MKIEVELNKKQEEWYEKWLKHQCHLKGNDGAIGGRIYFLIRTTGIGSIINARCDCGSSIDLTDVESW